MTKDTRIKWGTLAVLGVAAMTAAACGPRYVDRDGRPDFNDTPRERVCCKFRGGADAVMSRRACYRRSGRPVALRQCRID